MLALVYALALQIVRPTSGVALAGFVWPLLGVTPLLGLGLFFTAFSDNREGSYIVVAGSAMAVGSAFEVHVRTNPEVAFTPTFALWCALGMATDLFGTLGWTAAIASFPDGRLESPWQRRLLRLSWVALLAVPLFLWGSPTIYTSGWTRPAQRPPQPVCRRGARLGAFRWRPR